MKQQYGTNVRAIRSSSRAALMLLPPLLTAVALCLALPGGAHAEATLSSLAPRSVSYGDTVVASGGTTGAQVGIGVRVQQLVAGRWIQVGVMDTTDATGAWSVSFRPRRSGEVRALQVGGSAPGASITRRVFVAPVIMGGTLSRSRYPFLGTRARWRVLPTDYPDGPVTAEVRLGTVVVGTSKGRVRDGVVSLPLANNGVGSFSVRLSLPDRDTFEAATSSRLGWAQAGRRLAPGASGVWVRSMRAGLVFRGFHVPGGTTFGPRMGDSVVAFHKAFSRSRTTTFSLADWTTMTRRKVALKFSTPANHIEIDKGRQILIKVRDGKPWHIIHVSTGATGNTPTGTHEILWKGLWVPSNFGSLLFRSMAFQGGFAIHGYPDVPTTAASHGCVRVPMWIADWLYDHTPVGETVYVYEGPRSTVSSPGQRADTPELAGVDVAREADES